MSLRQKLAARGFCYQLMARPLFLLANQEEDGRYSNTLPAPLISPTARLIRLLWPDLHPGSATGRRLRDYQHEEFRSPSMVYSPTSLALPAPPLDSRALMWTRSQLFSDLIHQPLAFGTASAWVRMCFANVVLKTEVEIGDIKRARNLFDSLVQSHLQHAPG
ncbi:hypothetical protein C8R48DRAFT_781483 [Suillus tomentosus]|nr:hypothetical protein C8R48DRAFT_781483 [Suillus tomentosus]